MKRVFYIVLLFISTVVFSQNNGITYQAVIYYPGGQNIPGANIANLPMTNKLICLKFSFVDDLDILEYEETVKTTTDEFGMVNLTIGSGDQTGGYATSFREILWSTSNSKNLRVSLDTSS